MSIQRDPFHLCARCGFKTRLSQLVYQKGLLLCTVNDCVDNLDDENREQQIADALSMGADGQVDPKLVQDFDSLEETTPF